MAAEGNCSCWAWHHHGLLQTFRPGQTEKLRECSEATTARGSEWGQEDDKLREDRGTGLHGFPVMSGMGSADMTPYLQLRGSQGLVQFPELCFPPGCLQLLP